MNYISSEELFAEIREEMSSYFNTGAIDDMLFPRWTLYCLKRLKKSTMQVEATVIDINNHKGQLPDNFDSARAVWSCTVEERSVSSPVYRYSSRDIRLTPYSKCECPPTLPCECDPCKPDRAYQVTYKHTDEILFKFNKKSLLTPAGVKVRNRCSDDCLNYQPTCDDTFDIDGCNIYTSFAKGKLYIEYYAENVDEEGNIMIPDDVFVQQYITAYIRYKLFKKLLDSTTDETFNVMRFKFSQAEKEKNEAFIQAEIELKKKDKKGYYEYGRRNHKRFNRARNLYGL